MAKIAFILLCHKDPKAIVAQAERLTATGDVMAIHFDRNAPRADFDEICNALRDNPNVAIVKRRVKCGWGQWSLVQATINALKTASETFPRATHFYMVSGDCMAIKTAQYAHAMLDQHEVDYIETYDFFESDWIKTGFREERLIYRHFFNERAHKGLFYQSYNLQKRFGLSRDVPQDLQVMIGSQWWCLRRQTIEAVLDFIRARRDVSRFFRTTWIPDETFFQTLVHHLVPRSELECRTLTFLMFSDYGMPVTFHDDHYDLLLSQDFLFARKISPGATDLRARLGSLYSKTGVEFVLSDEGQSLFKFVTGRGRNGRRFSDRFWENGGSLGRDLTLMIVTCKKWHVAKRLVERIGQVTNVPTLEGIIDEDDTLPAFEYIFNEVGDGFPSLGGIGNSLEKRNNHRRALLKLLFEEIGARRILICLDPSDFDAMRDFYTDKARVRLLEIECEFTDEYLIGHAMRVGLAGETTPQQTIDRLLPTVRHDIQTEANQIRDAEFPNYFRMRESGTARDNAAALIEFLDITADQAHDIASTHYLFAD